METANAVCVGLPSSYFDNSWVWCSLMRLFSSQSFVITMSLSISSFGSCATALACGFGGILGNSRIGGDSEVIEAGEWILPLGSWLSMIFKFTNDWKDFVLFVCFRMGMELRRVGESAMICVVYRLKPENCVNGAGLGLVFSELSKRLGLSSVESVGLLRDSSRQVSDWKLCNRSLKLPGSRDEVMLRSCQLQMFPDFFPIFNACHSKIYILTPCTRLLEVRPVFWRINQVSFRKIFSCCDLNVSAEIMIVLLLIKRIET